MEYTTIEQFKTFFVRDFPFLPVFIDGNIYNKDVEVYYSPEMLFYKSMSNGTTSTPSSINTDWEQVDDDIKNYVLDTDVADAIIQADMTINTNLSPGLIEIAHKYLSAHILCDSISMSRTGLQSQYNGIVASKSVGSVSESFSIPEKMLKVPTFAWLNTTKYGNKYISLIYPYIIGGVGIAFGGSTP